MALRIKPKRLALAVMLGTSSVGACAPETAPANSPTVDRPPPAPARSPHENDAPLPQAASATVTILSTSEATLGTGEWGFAALVEVDGSRILFDTGAKRDTVLDNAKTLGVDLRTVEHVVLSHHHDDHVGGLLRLRTAIADGAPSALATVHVARGMFRSRHIGGTSREVNDMIAIRSAFEATGGAFVEHDGPDQIAPAVWVTGPVPRPHPERNWSGARRVPGPESWVEDQLHESQALVVDTADGLLVISGCGHAGVVNIATYVHQVVREAPLHLLGGFHLHRAQPDQLAWTMNALDELGLRSFYGAHCTGRAAVSRARENLAPEHAAEVEVGWSLQLPAGR